jgi:hypothetical protein
MIEKLPNQGGIFLDLGQLLVDSRLQFPARFEWPALSGTSWSKRDGLKAPALLSSRRCKRAGSFRNCGFRLFSSQIGC